MDYFVSKTGSDSNNGGLNSPFKTINKGLNKVGSGDKLIIRGGTYRGNAGWFPGNATASKPISIEAYQGEKVVLSALSELTGWEPYDLTNGKAIYRAPMPFTMCGESAIAGEDFLICNGKVLNEAQWPPANIDEYPQSGDGWAAVDSGRWISDASVQHSPVTGQIEDADLLNWTPGSLVGSRITILAGARWTLLSGTVIDNAGKTLTFTAKSPGDESFYQPDSRSLYFLFGKQEFLAYPGSWWRDPVSKYVYVWLPNGESPNNAIIDAKKDDKLFDFWSRDNYHFKGVDFVGATVHTPNVSGFSFRDCSFKHYTHRLYFDTTWSWFKPAIAVSGNNFHIENCDFFDSIGPAISANNQSNLTVENCVVINCMSVNFAGRNSRFIQNTVLNCPGPCLRLYQDCSGSQVKNNDLGHSGQMYTDEGVLLISKGCIGGHSSVSHNFIHDGMASADGAKEFYGSSGIYFDSETSGIVFDHNIVCKTTSSSVSLVANNGIENMLFYSNTFDSESGIYWVPESWGGKLPGCKFINNYAQKRAANTQFHPDIEFSRNAFKEAPSDGLPPNNLLATEPKFNSDYSLKPDSPLKNAGVAIAGITSTNPPDIGAWEGGFPIVGALLRQKDLPQIKATGTVVGSTAKIALSNLPTGRKPGDNFSIRISTGIASSDLNNVPVPFNSTLLSEIFASIGTDEWVKIGVITVPTTVPARTRTAVPWSSRPTTGKYQIAVYIYQVAVGKYQMAVSLV
ncbi:right-handed parallel beta-helix repeat-containing protein [Kamptonema sp. UHCC 0994]|uniref:right-handed parallel beta-helix repeat-containing protein n=1 Tax=Kamptonema sp. UHCC 0994 TaxID=3031329 RepID=UPI0023B9F611|nr:right-handed parallel beta-helix repeat-containing protein [Kamptonema sp. UHCC 0994]MDF0553131.1 right-handed parallel beta-helix repeat-containing protein [Kamptonema sp. UHCC 0994]